MIRLALTVALSIATLYALTGCGSAKPSGGVSQSTSPAGPAGVKTPDEKQDRDALIAFVKKHAQKPGGLEIIELKPPDKIFEGGHYHRDAVIRCELLDYSADSITVTGGGQFREEKLVPRPIYKDSVQVGYSSNGKVRSVHLREAMKTWE